MVALLLSQAVVACRDQVDYLRLLACADSLMETRPDSALSVLEMIPFRHLEREEEKARFALLLTQARDKNFIVHKNDSLIRKAVAYYDGVGDMEKQAEAYFYWGSVCRDRNEQALAVEKFRRAAIFAGQVDNQRLRGLIGSNIGFLYFLQQLYEEAAAAYREMEQTGIQLSDTGMWAEAVYMQGRIETARKVYSSAEDRLLQADSLARQAHLVPLQPDIAAALSWLYARMDDGEKALRYAKANLSLQADTLHCYRAFLLMGEGYFRSRQYDAAEVYFKKSLPTTDYSTKANVYMRLADIAKAKGKLDLFAEMVTLYQTYQDSLNIASQKVELLKRENKHQVEAQQRISEQRYARIRNIVGVLLLLVASVVFGWLWYVWKSKRNKQHVKILQEALQAKDTEIAALQRELAERCVAKVKKEELEEKLAQVKQDRLELANFKAVYDKIAQILAEIKQTDVSHIELTAGDWMALETSVDAGSRMGVLVDRCGLTEEERRICCLFLADYSPTNIGRILRCGRATVYRKKKEILEKMDVDGKGDLKQALKSLL